MAFRDARGRIPLTEWADGLREDVHEVLWAKLEMLALHGHRLRRPHADILRDGIHELRIKHRGSNLRLLYFFHGVDTIVITHGFTKTGSRVPEIEIDRACHHRTLYLVAPGRHTAEGV